LSMTIGQALLVWRQTVLQATKGVLGVAGRVMLCGVFISAALGYAVPSVQNVAENVGSTGLLGGKWALVGGIALLAWIPTDPHGPKDFPG
jgi:uncharacterized membrane protein YraQ (UPF0718 family)